MKRKTTILSEQQKAAITEQLNRGISVKYLARQYEVSRDEIVSIHQENKHLIGPGNRGGNSLKRKARRRCSIPETEDHLYKWIKQQQVMGFQLTDPLIVQKAIELCGAEERIPIFQSKEWLVEFKRRYKIGVLWDHRGETFTREDIEEIIADVFNEHDNEEEAEMFNEAENIAQGEQEKETYVNKEGGDDHGVTDMQKSQLSSTERKNNDLNILREIIRKYACNNEAVLIMGEALVTILERNITETMENLSL